MNYEAMRAVFRRINAALGTNHTMHDLRHVAALRISRDKDLTLLATCRPSSVTPT
ncbi:hypothetical protein ACGFYU_21235 [Streptomyces sp. NPDC048337]|uniref:hypothetical protein n=1 Tax=Streptomyces sp. NPDC048337 TaxID=3365535 RepID=UPI003720B79B